MAAAYSQQGTKRPKIREATRGTDAVEYFPGSERVEYDEDAAPTESAIYRYYNASERLHGRSMEEWLRLAVSLTAFRSDGSDRAGKPTYSRAWDDRSASLDSRKRAVKACFEFCVKLGLKYWTAFDGDLTAGEGGGGDSGGAEDSSDMAEFLLENMQRTRVKPLWIAPDLHSHPRYASGAATSCDADVYMRAAAQVKQAMELAQRISSECFLIWPYREGYDALFKSDVAREMKHFAKLLKMAAEYKERLTYRGQLLIMPHYGDNTTRNMEWDKGLVRENESVRYMWDVTSCLYFLKHYNLDRHYKVCVPPGHQMYMANAYNMLGGVFISNAVNEFDHRSFTQMMKNIIDQGAAVAGGVTLSVAARRDSVEPRDMLCAYVNRVDSLARALRAASRLTADQLFSKYVQQRYASYYSGSGARLASTDVTLEECEEHARKSRRQAAAAGVGRDSVTSSRAEHWDAVFERYASAAPPPGAPL